MKLFTQLFNTIDQTTKTNAKITAMVGYFGQASERDVLVAIALLIGNRPKRPVKTGELKQWAAEYAGIPDWLFDESYYVVGDLAETIALLLPKPQRTMDPGLSEVIDDLGQLLTLETEAKREKVLNYWQSLEGNERFVFNKLITGNFRMGVSRQLVAKALAQFLAMQETSIAHRLMGKWNPKEESLASLFSEEASSVRHYQPYPFYLAYPLEGQPEELGDIGDWIIERKLDGIRGQIIFRNKELFIWSRGEDLLTDKFPEFGPLKDVLPGGTVIDGEIIPYRSGRYLGFGELQTRIGRKNLSKKLLADVPLVMICYDLLEWQGEDIRHKPLFQRRELLAKLLDMVGESHNLRLSEALSFGHWDKVADFRRDARLYQCEGVMLKHKDSPYESGRRRGNWWKWKTDPMTIDGVMIYAQSGHGRRANLYTDYTFAVWDEEGNLLPFAKAYSGLTDKEIVSLDNWIKRNTIEKFGPVRSVKPFHVFEIAFEGIQASSRHKSGVALRFPRILRWRRDKDPEAANTKADLLQLIATVNG